jgi:hypothetical protein
MRATKNRGKDGWSRNVSTDTPTLDVYASGQEMFQICGDATAQDTFEESATQLHEIGCSNTAMPQHPCTVGWVDMMGE